MAKKFGKQNTGRIPACNYLTVSDRLITRSRHRILQKLIKEFFCKSLYRLTGE